MSSVELTSTSIGRIMMAVRDGTAETEDAKRLMVFFCESVEDRKDVPGQLLEHFAEVFRAILSGYRYTGTCPVSADFVGPPDPRNWKWVSCESALGLGPDPKSKGRPKSAEKGITTALAVLRYLLTGMTLEGAIAEIFDKGVLDATGMRLFSCSASAAAKAWSKHKVVALDRWLAERRPSAAPLTSAEKARVRAIYSKEMARSDDIVTEAQAGRWLIAKKCS